MITSKIKNNFKNMLKYHKIKQLTLSNSLGCCQSLISRWCNGLCEPSLNAIIKMSETFNIPIEEIVLSFRKEQVND